MRDGRHLMNGTRWTFGDATDEPPAWCIGRRLIPEGAQHAAHACVTGGLMDDWREHAAQRGLEQRVEHRWP